MKIHDVYVEMFRDAVKRKTDSLEEGEFQKPARRSMGQGVLC